MQDAFSRTELLLGGEAMARLASSTVAIFGLGGVGSWAAEALARAGVGGFVLVDDDVVSPSNINRQLVALDSTVGRPKVEVMAERIAGINPAARVLAFREYYSANSAARLLVPGLSYIVDAIDSVSSKLDLIERATAAGLPIMSAMGTGNKLDPLRLEVADISETSMCPLARLVRKELRKRGIGHLKVVFSTELPGKATLSCDPMRPELRATGATGPSKGRRSVPGSVSFVPPVAGFIIAGEVVKDLIASCPRPSAAELDCLEG
jgi:tRNA A37 threonylcarbamoyladenosine dehydratase